LGKAKVNDKSTGKGTLPAPQILKLALMLLVLLMVLLQDEVEALGLDFKPRYALTQLCFVFP